MIKGIIKIGLLLVVGIVAYNYFLGTPAEKESSKKILGEVKNLGAAAVDLLKKEKEKYEAGKYDGALEKLGNAFSKIKDKASDLAENGGKYLDQIKELEKQKKALEESLKTTEEENMEGDELTEKGQREMKKIEAKIRELIQDTEKVAEEMDEGSE